MRLTNTEELPRDQLLLRMEQLTLVNGSTDLEMASAHNFGPMVQDTKASGKAIRPTAKASLFMLMVTFTKASGSMTKLKEREPTRMRTELITKESGTMISNTVTVSNLGRMERVMKALTKMARKRDKADLPSLMEATTKAYSTKTRFLATETTTGQMESLILVTGPKTKWTVKAS